MREIYFAVCPEVVLPIRTRCCCFLSCEYALNAMVVWYVKGTMDTKDYEPGEPGGLVSLTDLNVTSRGTGRCDNVCPPFLKHHRRPRERIIESLNHSRFMMQFSGLLRFPRQMLPFCVSLYILLTCQRVYCTKRTDRV